MFDDATLLVLAGGRGDRLQKGPKDAVEVAGRPLLAWVLDRRSAFAHTMILGAPTPSLRAHGVPIVDDRIPGRGAPGGLWSGLEACATPWACLLACDMPLVDPLALERLYEHRAEADAVVAVVDGFVQGTHAFYRVDSVRPVAARIVEEGRSLRDILAAVRTVEVALDDLPDTVANVNTPEDLEAVSSKLRPA